MSQTDSICPGCGLSLPRNDTAVFDGYYNASAECWGLYTEVLGAEYSNAVLFGQVHQLTVDAYAVQHAGGTHPDKSVGIHLCGLHLVIERGVSPPRVPPLLQRLAGSVAAWPRLDPPASVSAPTVFDVAFCDTAQDHATVVKEWSQSVWTEWSQHHSTVEALIAEHLAGAV